MKELIIKDLHVKIENKKILKGINLKIRKGEVHALMGINGSGKSTLANVIMGNPIYKVVKGDILVDGKSILDLAVDERARMGIFHAMQSPVEIKGVLNADFLRTAINARREKPIEIFEFITEYENKSKEMGISKDLSSRYLNFGYSGGEKKRNEILQLKILKPEVALIDEIDSGLDVDALKQVGENIQKETNNMATLIITHYERIFDYITPNFVHVLKDGKMVAEGGPELIAKIDKEGYDWIK